MSHRINLGRKIISDKSYLFDLETLSQVKKLEPINNGIKIVYDENYTIGNENIILVKSENSSNIFLNEKSNDSVVIKSLTNTTIKTSTKIDEYYDEISIGKGACVELMRIENYWYILSSDGIKLS